MKLDEAIVEELERFGPGTEKDIGEHLERPPLCSAPAPRWGWGEFHQYAYSSPTKGEYLCATWATAAIRLTSNNSETSGCPPVLRARSAPPT